MEYGKDVKKIKKILKKYNIYDKHRPINDFICNKPDNFFDNFIFNDQSGNPLPDNIQRNKSGRIILDDVPFLRSNEDNQIYRLIHNRNMPSWIILSNGSKILLKTMLNTHIEYEVFLMYILNELDVSCAKVDIATLNNKDYLISNCFYSTKERIEDPLKYISKEYSYAYNINTLIKIAQKGNYKEFMLKVLFTDIIYGMWDRFPNNFGIIKNGFSVRPAPIFDNAECSLLKIWDSFPMILGRNDPDFVIKYLLTFDYVSNWVKDYMRDPVLPIAVSKLEKEKGIILGDTSYNIFETFFKDSEQLVNDALKEKGEAFRIKLT